MTFNHKSGLFPLVISFILFPSIQSSSYLIVKTLFHVSIYVILLSGPACSGGFACFLFPITGNILKEIRISDRHSRLRAGM